MPCGWIIRINHHPSYFILSAGGVWRIFQRVSNRLRSLAAVKDLVLVKPKTGRAAPFNTAKLASISPWCSAPQSTHTLGGRNADLVELEIPVLINPSLL